MGLDGDVPAANGWFMETLSAFLISISSSFGAVPPIRATGMRHRVTQRIAEFKAQIRVRDDADGRECVAHVNNCHANEKETKKLLKLFPEMPLIRV